MKDDHGSGTVPVFVFILNRPFGTNRNCQNLGRRQLEEEAGGELSTSCLIEASQGDAVRRQYVDLAVGYNFAACSIGILSLPSEIFFVEILSCPLGNRKPRR